MKKRKEKRKQQTTRNIQTRRSSNNHNGLSHNIQQIRITNFINKKKNIHKRKEV